MALQLRAEGAYKSATFEAIFQKPEAPTCPAPLWDVRYFWPHASACHGKKHRGSSVHPPLSTPSPPTLSTRTPMTFSLAAVSDCDMGTGTRFSSISSFSSGGRESPRSRRTSTAPTSRRGPESKGLLAVWNHELWLVVFQALQCLHGPRHLSNDGSRSTRTGRPVSNVVQTSLPAHQNDLSCAPIAASPWIRFLGQQ